jgi:hypothetical protein
MASAFCGLKESCSGRRGAAQGYKADFTQSGLQGFCGVSGFLHKSFDGTLGWHLPWVSINGAFCSDLLSECRVYSHAVFSRSISQINIRRAYLLVVKSFGAFEIKFNRP